MSKLSWKVYMENLNTRKIIEYDIFAGSYWRDRAAQLKREYPDRKIWEEAFSVELMSRFWCKSEYEIILTSWPPYIEVNQIEELQKEVEEHKEKWGRDLYHIDITPTVAEKIDIYDQLMLNKEVFFDYVWRNI